MECRTWNVERRTWNGNTYNVPRTAYNNQLGEDMAKVVRFEDLQVWKEGMRLSRDIYTALGESKDYSLKNQMQRASVSIPSNIAEGFERQTNKEFVQYLYIAKGSCAELRTQIYLAQELGKIEKYQANDYIEQSRKISSMLYKLIQSIKRKQK